MKRIATAIIANIATTAVRQSWAMQDAAARCQARGERMEAWANRLAARWGVVEPVLTTVTTEALR
jgi:hypothetical protein